MELEVTFKRASIVWWAITWRAILIIISTTILFSVVSKFMDSSDKSLLINGLNVIVGIIVDIFILKKILNKKFKQFKISILANGNNLEITNKIVLKIWWAQYWRKFFYGFLLVIPILFVCILFALFLKPISLDIISEYKFLFFISIFIVGLFISIQVTKIVLKKDFKVFRIALLANEPQNENLTEKLTNA